MPSTKAMIFSSLSILIEFTLVSTLLCISKRSIYCLCRIKDWAIVSVNRDQANH